MTEMEKLRIGLEVPCHDRNTLLVNVYACDGNAHRRDGGQFFDTELLCLLWHAPQNCIVGGNFNCVLSPLDCNNGFRPCRTPEALLKLYRLNDIAGYIHITHKLLLRVWIEFTQL